MFLALFLGWKRCSASSTFRRRTCARGSVRWRSEVSPAARGLFFLKHPFPPYNAPRSCHMSAKFMLFCLGQRKRVSIALELLADPSLLLVDEPTSGLDSKMAADVIRILKSLAREGRTVICTVHQPSFSIYSAFERLLLLSRGAVVFDGPVDKASGYFAALGFRTPPNENPAEYFLNVLGGNVAGLGSFEACSTNSPTSSPAAARGGSLRERGGSLREGGGSPREADLETPPPRRSRSACEPPPADETPPPTAAQVFEDRWRRFEESGGAFPWGVPGGSPGGSSQGGSLR